MDTGAAGAARENDVLQASHATDRATMSRVAEALRGQLDGQVIPAAAVVIGPVELLERRTCTLLGPLYAKGATVRTRELETLKRNNPDLAYRVAKWRAEYPMATLRDAVADLDLWPRPDDQDAQWLIWTVLKDAGDPEAGRAGFPAMRAAAKASARCP